MLNTQNQNRLPPISYLYFALFFISGISGLIYESIWSQYLKQFLGHAAYAQSLVLIIFMGGMALGSWLAAILSSRYKNLLFAYAVVEIALGVLALVFHDAFILYLNISFENVIPFLGKPLPITLYKWLTASLIILPQSMLLGATFPFMAGGMLRRFKGLSGYKTSFIYFINTLGAALGVLFCGFYLVKNWGLQGAIIAGGMLDILVGIWIIALCMYDKRQAEISNFENNAQSESVSNNAAKTDNVINDEDSDKKILPCTLEDRKNFYYPLLFVAGATSAAHFMYQIGWIRMLSLVLGSSTHSFELMLSAFILGLALGSFFVRNKLDSIKNAPMFLSVVQIAMGATAILTLFTYGNMFRLMVFTIDGLDRTAEGYVFYNIISHVICMIIMLPTAICAGMVVPLIIHMLYKRGYGEQSIGKVYAVNTFGGIIGVIATTWIFMELVGLKYVIIIGAALDMGLGLYVLYRFRETRESFVRVLAQPAVILLLMVAFAFGKFDPVLASSGVFRYGSISRAKRIIEHVDGKTASITLFKSGSGKNLVLSTNGKPDASVGIDDEVSGDEYTMALLGVLPLAVHESAQTAAVIGMGAGMTSHFMLYDPQIEHIDIIEIEPAMARLAKRIGTRVRNTFNDPRSHIHIEDAKTFFSARGSKYDIIVSEPSNPWVSGVSSLFSKEFFARIKNHLNDGGILMQWFHIYEADISILVSILKALEESFPVYELYLVSSDLLIIAAKEADADISIKRDVFEIPQMAMSLGHLGFTSLDEFRLLRYGDQRLFGPIINDYNTPANSDFHSYVDLHAVKYRFMGTQVRELIDIRDFVVPIRKIVFADTGYLALNPRGVIPDLYNLHLIQTAKNTAFDLMYSVMYADSARPVAASTFVFDYAAHRPERIAFSQIQSATVQILQSTLPYLSREEMLDIWSAIEEQTAKINFSEEEFAWMDYIRALCHYDAEEILRLSLEILPEGSIEGQLGTRMLMASLFASAAALDTIDERTRNAIERAWNRYDEKHNPPASIRAAKILYEQRQH